MLLQSISSSGVSTLWPQADQAGDQYICEPLLLDVAEMKLPVPAGTSCRPGLVLAVLVGHSVF